MAKSLRSKRQRKMRAIKRIRYGEKELARLKKMLETEDETVERVEVTTSKKRKSTSQQDVEKSVEGWSMICSLVSSQFQCFLDVTHFLSVQKKDVDSKDNSQPKRKRKSGCLMDKNGSFPIWLHPRQRKKISKKLKNKKKHSKKN